MPFESITLVGAGIILGEGITITSLSGFAKRAKIKRNIFIIASAIVIIALTWWVTVSKLIFIPQLSLAASILAYGALDAALFKDFYKAVYSRKRRGSK
ncbi:hypothetical protein FACS1894217_10870 [Clostridia bacterium]|nr:hypothetical protein FACS1894217_10870 [Clostridia bacterium]